MQGRKAKREIHHEALKSFPIFATDILPTYLHSAPQQPVYATQAPQRPPIQFHQQYRAPPPSRPARQFTQLGMPLSQAFQRLVEGGLIAPLPPRPPPHPTSPRFKTDLHYTYHQRASHDTNNCVMLRHAIQDLIDQGLVDLGCLTVTTNPLPTHDTRVVPPPSGNVHLIEFSGDEIFMMGGAERLLNLLVYTRTQILVDISMDNRALSHIRVDTATTPGGLIHFLTDDKATCIVFSDNDLPPERSDHVRPLFIDVVCSGHRVSPVLLDNDSALNVCPLVTAIALGFSPSNFGPSTQTSRAYDETQRTVMGTLTTHVMISLGLGHRQQGPREFAFIVDHDIPYGLGYTPSKDDLADYFTRGSDHAPRIEGVDRVHEAIEPMCFPCAFLRRSLTMDLGDGFDGVILPDTYMDKMDMIGTGPLFASPPRPRSAFDVFGISMLEFDGDGLVATDITHDTIFVQGASNSVDPPLSFDTMSRKVDCVPSWCLEFGPQTGVINKIYNLYHHALG
ncbi:hypothetical protein CK203_063604 [Vitis vinifera]|uniref:Uncharacterized protein n=1 Tax=Vitis vinifera TaxID=29760 RepID=A0A438G341_VITVI|nr:hypothetical protein CK203_063604 [Vitis vinifera]